ncbi:MAG: ABC transporter ATP-binding protein, partial [Gordonibacter sp.]
FTMGLYLISAACSFVQGWMMSSISQRTCYELRRDIASKIDRMPMGYFERNSVGDTLSRITNDVDTLGQSLNQGITQLITSVVSIIGVLVMMLTINPLMTLITVVILPISLGLIMIVVKKSQKFFFAQQKTLGEINGIVEETFSGHAIVKAFNREDGTVDTFNETNARLYNSAWKSQFISGLMQPIMGFVSNLGYVVVAITGSFMAVQGIITVGDIQAFIQYVKNFTQPITQLTQVSNVLQQMAAAAERIFEFLDAPEEEPDHVTARSEDACCGVEFEHVHFGYDPERPVIEDFSATVEEGQTIALVGPTGAGKTTMVKLLMRFYDVQAGSIKIGGHDLREFARDDLRSMFGMVLQDTWLFNGTIRDNIRYGKLDATDEEVEAAAKAAYVYHFIQTLPAGFDTEINEDASNISQGQRQLLTIARAILADRRMLILDEATSSVDTRTEERIQKAMDNLMAGRTSFVIAHRLSTIRSANLILVMRDGDIVEQGTHEQLLELGGFYAELYNSQFAETIDEAEE